MSNKFPKETSLAINQRVKEFYESRCITPTTYAAKIGIGRDRLYKMIDDSTDFQVSLLYKIKVAFPDFDIDYCLFGNDVPHSNVINNKGIFMQNSSNNNNIVAGSDEDKNRTIVSLMDELVASNDFYREMVKKTTGSLIDMVVSINNISEGFKEFATRIGEILDNK